MLVVFLYVFFISVMKGVSADADPHYQKLYGRVTDVCSNRRGQPSPSAMKEPRPGRNPSVIRFASPSGKYEFQTLFHRPTFKGPITLVATSWGVFLQHGSYFLDQIAYTQLYTLVFLKIKWNSTRPVYEVEGAVRVICAPQVEQVISTPLLRRQYIPYRFSA